MVTNRTRRTWFIVFTLGGCGLLALLAIEVFPPQVVLASRLGSELTSLPDDEVLNQLHRIGDLDEAGTGVLVEALTSDREAVSDGAKLVLHNQMVRWRLLSSRQSTPKVAFLAQHLARKIDALDDAGRTAAIDLAEQILLWPIDHATVRSEQLIANCEIVLRSSRTRPLATIANRHGGRRTELTTDLPPEFLDIPSLPSQQPNAHDSVNRSRGAQLPIEKVLPDSVQPRMFVPSNELRIESN